MRQKETVEQYLARGGKIAHIPFGVGTEVEGKAYQTLNQIAAAKKRGRKGAGITIHSGARARREA